MRAGPDAAALEVLKQLRLAFGVLRDALNDHPVSCLHLIQRKLVLRDCSARAGNGVPMRAGRRATQHTGDLLLHFRRDGVLEAAGLLMGLVPVQTENVGEQSLRKAVTAYRALGDL